MSGTASMDQKKVQYEASYCIITLGHQQVGDAGGPWACKSCNDPTINDDIKTAGEKWTVADGNGGWDSIKKWWTVLYRGGQNPNPFGAISGFVQPVSWNWNGPTERDCSNIGETHCNSVVKCQDTNVPVGGMVMTSFANIHMLGLIGAGIWNKILKDSPSFKNKGNDHGWAKDSANAAVANSVTLAKDSQPGVQGQMNTLNDIRSELGTLVDGWANVTQKYMTNLFLGSDDALTQLDAYIKDGHWADPYFDNTLYSLRGVMENVLYGQLIPKAWSEHTAVHPVVVFQSGNDNLNPLTPLFKGDASKTLSDDDAKAARTQYGGTTLWLLDAHDCVNKEPVARGGSGTCDDPFVKPLPGASQLNGGKWGGVLVDDITISSFVGYQINNNANGYVMPENSRFTSMNKDADYPFQAGIRTPGFFSIPVCDINKVFDVTVRNRGNQGTANRCPTWPCC